MSTILREQSGFLARTDSHGSLNHCGECGAVSFAYAENCQRCGGDELEQLPQIGEIFSYTTVHQGANSFVLALVELSGGQFVTARIVGVVRELRIGLPVELAHDKMSSSRSGGLFFSPLLADCFTK